MNNILCQSLPVRTIVGGSEAERNSWPFIVTLVSAHTENLVDGHFCGGALISPYWVISASHCLPDETPDTVDVIIGAHNLRTDSPDSYKRIKVSEIYLHPAFDTGTHPNIDGDIALIRLEEPVFDVEPIPLIYDPSFAKPGTIARVAGWGLVIDQGEASEVLREVEMPIVSLETANASGAYDSPLTADMLVAGVKEGGKDSCQGDSGGPLIVPIDDEGNWGLAGIVSFGSPDGCAAPNAYGVYAKVSYFHHELMKWIYSDYARWSNVHNVSGFYSDDDEDLRNAFSEFAFGSNPNLKDKVTSIDIEIVSELSNQEKAKIRYKKVRSEKAVSYVLSRSSDLRNWQNISASELELDQSGSWVEWTANPDVGDTPSFYRLEAQPTTVPPLPDYFVGDIRFMGHLDPSREFTIGGFSDSEEVSMQFIVHNSETAQLEVRNAGTGAVLVSTSDAQDGKIEYSFTPQPGTDYTVSLSAPDGEEESGTFSFNMPPIEVGDIGGGGDNPLILPGDTKEGELTAEDVFFEGFYERLYQLSGVNTGQKLRITLSADQHNPNFLPFLVIYDSETFEEVISTESQENTEVTLTLDIEAGITYLIGASNFEEGQKGKYQLKVESISGSSNSINTR